MKKIITIVFCLVFLYLFVSPTFTSSIVFGQEIKSCDDVRRWEHENYPTVVYTPYPVGNYTNDAGTVINVTYLVYVTKPKDNVDVRLKISGVAGINDFTIIPFFGVNPTIDPGTTELVTNFNGTFALVLWYPTRDQLGKTLDIAATNDWVFVNRIPKENAQEFVESLLVSNLFLAHLGNKDLNPNPQMSQVSLAMLGVVGSMIPGTDKVYFSGSGVDVLYLTELKDQFDIYNFDTLKNIFNNPSNFHHFGNIGEAYDYLNRRWGTDWGFSKEQAALEISTLQNGERNLIIDISPLAIKMDEGGIFFDRDIISILSFYLRNRENYQILGWSHVHPINQPKLSLGDFNFMYDSLIFDTTNPSATLIVRTSPSDGTIIQIYDYTIDKIVLNVDMKKLIEEYGDIELVTSYGDLYECVHNANPSLGSPSDDEYLAITLGAHLNNFWYYSDISLLTDQITTDLSLNPNSQTFKNQIKLDLDAIRELKQNIPPTLSPTKQGDLIQKLTDIENALTKLDNGEITADNLMTAQLATADINTLAGYDGVASYEIANYYFTILNNEGYSPSEWSKEWLLNNLKVLDAKYSKIEQIINDPFTVLVRKYIPEDEENGGIFYSIDKALENTAVRTFAESALYFIFTRLGSEILDYGTRTHNQIAYYIGIGIQWYFTFRWYFYVGSFIFHTVIGLIITLLSEGIMAGLTFLASQIISFVAGLIVGFIISIIFQIIWCLIFSCSTQHFNCELDTPWYNDEHTGIREKVVRLGDTIHYVYYGVRYCYDPDYSYYITYPQYFYNRPDHLTFFVDLFYENSNFGPDIFGNGTIFDLHTSYCTTLDGRCFDCSVNVTKPGPEIPDAKNDFPGSFDATATWNDMEQLSHPRYPSHPFKNPIPILVCPEDKGPDESENKCVDCNSNHTESGFCTGTNTANCNSYTTEKDCLANPCCDYDGFKCYPRESCNIFNNSVCNRCGCYMQSSGTCEEGCGASPECDERSSGSWCDPNGITKKTCNSTCQYSEEICRTDAYDSDGGENYKIKGTCTQYNGCASGECVSNTETDSCLCYPQSDVNGDGIIDMKDRILCGKMNKTMCDASQTCYWALNEYFVSDSSCVNTYYNCSDYGSNYVCSKSYGICMICPDINFDGKIEIKDLVLVIKAYGSYPGHPLWNPNADINFDNKVDIKDLVLVIKYYGKVCER